MRALWWIGAAIVAADQVTKWAALAFLSRHGEVAVAPFLNFTLVFNRGAAFGFLSDAPGWQNGLFIAVALFACGLILYFLYRLERDNRWVALGLVLILAGAVGNLIDRLIYGYVIDFIDVYYQAWHWPAFNIADAAITVGALLLIFDAVSASFRERRAASTK